MGYYEQKVVDALERIADALEEQIEIFKKVNHKSFTPASVAIPARETPMRDRTSRDADFISFDQALKELNIDEARLKRLVSEGEIRCFREGDGMKFRLSEIQRMRD
jgi:exonuclease VII small subunit